MLGSSSEIISIACVPDWESANGKSIDFVDPCWKFVSPCNVVACTGGQNFDLGMFREEFSNITGMQFGSAINFFAVALNDDRQLHVFELPVFTMDGSFDSDDELSLFELTSFWSVDNNSVLLGSWST